MMEQVWKDQGVKPGTINTNVTKAFANKYWAGVTKGYGADFPGVVFDTPDYNMLKALQQNVWHFSAAKNYTQLRELGAALLDENGKLRSKDDFFKAAAKINDQFTKRYMSAEYELAVAGGQMAGKWVNIQANINTLGFLEFDAVLDSQTTSLCRGLNGTKLPVNHPFWNQYYPPNHFGCRSTVRSSDNGSGVTAEDKIPTADIPKMFQTNLGKQGLIFPKDHPYFIDIPDSIKEQAIKLLPYEQQFNKIQHKGDGLLQEHILNDKAAPDYTTVKRIAIQQARKNNVDILPRFANESDEARSIILPDAKLRKYPDLRINGTLYEVEEVKKGASVNTLKHAIASGSKQADSLIIQLNDVFSNNDLKRISNSRFKDHKLLQEIQFVQPNGEYLVFKRQKD